MSTKPTKLQRWLDMVAFLAGRRLPVSTDELWNAVPAYHAGLDGSDKDKQTVRRMFERDKDELRGLGIPIETVPYSINFGLEQATGYRLATRDFHLPYLRLVADAQGAEGEGDGNGRAKPTPAGEFPIARDEARAALEGLTELATLPAFPLRTAARSAFRKLAFDLDPEFLREPPVVYAQHPETVATRDAMHLLSDALHRRKAVAFRYRGMTRDTDDERRVHPYGLLFQHGRWYLVGQDLDQNAIRMFRVGRISDVQLEHPKEPKAEYHVPGRFELESYAGRSAWDFGEDPEGPIDVMVLFSFPRSLWAERNAHGDLVEAYGDGSQKRRFRIVRRDPFLRWVLSLAGDARVEEPEFLREEFQALVQDVARRYNHREGGDDA